MRLVDTSAWIEWLSGTPLGPVVAAELPPAEAWLVPTLVQYELAKWLSREADEDRADRVVAFTSTCVVMPLETPVALMAADLGARHKLAMADAIVYASARSRGADLLTCDGHFQGLPGVHYLSKRKG